MAYNITRMKLQEYTDTTEFEHLCCALLVADYKRLIPLGGSRDKGRDAVEPPPFPGTYQDVEGGTIFQFSLQKTWRNKLNSEINKIFANGFKPSAYIFVTNQEINVEAKTKCQEEIWTSFGLKLDIFELSWLQARLESPDYLMVRRQYFSLDETTLPAFLNPTDYGARRLDRQRAPDFPIFIGREVEYERIRQVVASEKRVLVLSASPGIGKTKLMLEVAKGIQFEGDVRFLRQEVDSIESHLDELDPQKVLLLFIDDAHELRDLRQLIALILSPELGDKIHVVMTTHPWARQRIVGEFESKAIDCEVIELSPLPNPAIDQLIQLPQIGVTGEEQRGAVIKIAEGNPLVAYVAASLLKETGTLSGLTRHQVVMSHFAKSLQAALAGQPNVDKARLLLAIVSATKGIEYGNFRELIADTVELTPESLDALVEQLEAAGLLIRSWRGLRVTPELLAENLVFDTFFATGHLFDFKEKVLTPFFALKGSKIFRSLAESERLGAAGAAAIIDQFMIDARDFVKTADNASRQAMLEWLKGFAYFRPEDALIVLRSMLESPIAEPTTVKSPVWGRMTISNADVWRSACAILAETGWHCEACLKETMNLLYLIGAQQDHSRSNSYPLEDAIRVLDEQVIPFEPGKPLRVQEIAVQEIARWLSLPTSEQQLDVITSALLTMFSVAWTRTSSSPTDSRSFTFSRGLINITEPIRKIREAVSSCLITAYQRCVPAQRVRLIRQLSQCLVPYAPSGIPEELRVELADDSFKIISRLNDLTGNGSVAERFALWKELQLLDRLNDGRLRGLQQTLSNPELDMYAHLIEWPGHIRERNEDWKAAEAKHGAYWEERASRVSKENLDAELGQYDGLIQAASVLGDQDTSALQVNIGTLAKSLSIASPDLLPSAIQKIEAKYKNLERFAGTFLGEFFSVNQIAARETMKAWITGKNAALRLEACRAMLWIPPEQFSVNEVELLNYLMSLNDTVLDRAIVGWFGGIMRKVDHCDPKAAVKIISVVSSRKDRFALKMIAEVLEPGRSISQITAQELSDVALNFVELDEHELDFDVERMLMRLFLIDPDSWLAFWEARINRERAKKEGEKYFAAPFHLSAESDYVVKSPHRIKVLGTFLEWSSSRDFAFQHNGARLFKLYSDKSPEVLQEVMESWLASGEHTKQRGVAKVLKEIGYCDSFLAIAKRLLDATDDELVSAYLRDTVGSTGVVSGSISPVYEKRKADFEAWLADPGSSLRAKAFARHQVAYLTRQIELHAKEDRDE